jgi:hypothetical protein
MVFEYPVEKHIRRHGPRGYTQYKSYKPWIRDDFTFRCIYCLCRERWFPTGHDSFAVEHVQAKSANPAVECDYDNLAYACSACNSAKGTAVFANHPCEQGLGEHLEVLKDGSIHARDGSRIGNELIEICRLNRPRLVEARQRFQQLYAGLKRDRRHASKKLLRTFFGYPDDLPILAGLVPPKGNLRPKGIARSYAALRDAGSLPEIY